MKKKWYFENLRAEALKYQTRGEFKRGSYGAYCAARRSGILDQICSHMPKHVDQSGENNPFFKWTFEMLQKEALKYNTRSEFKKCSYGAYQAAWGNGFLDEICSHMKLLRKSWSYEELHQEALRFNTRLEFQKNSNNAYSVAQNRGVLDQICVHMGESLTEPWLDEELHQEALRFNTRTEFATNSRAAYYAALRRGILDQICSHMKRVRGSSIAEKELFAIIKSIYPQAKKIKDRGVAILGKPHIHGFEIDILVDKLGIEFDGTYHHSFKFMRSNANKILWSDEDIRNYHEIKDAHFLTKGIQILHIKEEDWNLNKESCIMKCLDFLTISTTRLAT